uniref:Uncharacterized protein n=1 Tax=Streptomyces sp. NBC_00093 TaxID=2975649 RepID=A0AAU1ZZZ3_9ACTN
MTDTTITATEPGELAIAIRVGQKMLARYGTVDSGDIFDYAQAHGGLTEALRILLRAHGAEPEAPDTSATEPLYGGNVDQFIDDAYDSLADSDLDDEPVDEDEAARRSVDRAFPVVAAFLATERAERGEGQ